ncbi:MAG TPA: sigma-54 dependent transcriptional regulator [Candidatus Binatia bacterium]|nr:sigma-54 dependent transcriptional regulator [Candidatus Binatia bacterium]
MGQTILVVDDDPDIREIIADRLESLGYRVVGVSTGGQALARLESREAALVLLDLQLPDMSGLDVLRALRQRGDDATVVMITAYGTIERAVQAMRDGAYDFIPKPFTPDQVTLTVRRALEREGLRREVAVLSDAANARERLILGEDPGMQCAVELARKAAAARSTVLLLGESGTGKEIVARAIHRWSDRASQPFVAVNCVALSRELLESDLFGHERGAFTGAHQLKKGKIELAHGGTVLLDEVGDVPLELQTKLLRFLQERELERVGGTRPISVDVRIVAATNRDLDRAVHEGRFREDLYYRLNVIPIILPPLRERSGDLPVLAEFFLQRFAAETKKRFAGIAPEAMERLRAHTWPGNVRELANVIERAIVLGSGPMITPDDLPRRLADSEPRRAAESLSYREALARARRALIIKALARTEGNRAAAARALGLHKTHLFKLMKALGID